MGRKRRLWGVLCASLSAVLTGSDECSTPSPTNHAIRVGEGYTDVSPHQLVRTSGNVVYTVAPSCASFPACPGSVIHVFKANAPGTPTGFVEVDSAHAPSGGVGSPAVGIDGGNRIHVVWNKSTGKTKYNVFDTATDTWGTNETLGSSDWTDFTQGQEGTALALDGAGIPHVVWSYRTNVDGLNHQLRLKYQRRLSTGWEAPIDIADVVDCNPASSFCNAWHPTLAFAPNGDLYLAWLNGHTNEYTKDGRIRVRKRTAAGSWEASVAIPDTALSTIDNGPSMITTPDGTIHLTFNDYDNHIRYWYNDGTGWKGDQQPPTQTTHDPALGTDVLNSIYIYGHGTPVGNPGGHGEDMYYFEKPVGGGWSAWTLYATGDIDSSVSTRWSQYFYFHPENADILYWADAYPNILYLGVN